MAGEYGTEREFHKEGPVVKATKILGGARGAFDPTTHQPTTTRLT